jgi:DNA-binding NtrC family response regulator
MSDQSRAPKSTITVAVASRDQVYLDSLSVSLSRFGIKIRQLAPGGDTSTVSLEDVEVLVLDTDSLTGPDFEWVESLKRDQPLVEVLAIAGDSTVTDAVRALRAGAFAVLQHPVPDPLLIDELVAAGRRHRHARKRLDELNCAEPEASLRRGRAVLDTQAQRGRTRS